MNNYCYPDQKDYLTEIYIKKKELFPGYWYNSEQYILDVVKMHLNKHITPGDKVSLLDAGCGDGRLLHEIGYYFSNILAVDADPGRLKSAIKSVKESELAQKVIFRNVSIENINIENKFDAIFCSHVLQHVHTGTLKQILEKMSKLIKKNGLIFLMTCHSILEHDYFIKSYLKGSELIEETINEEQFNQLVLNIEHILPIHFYARKALEKELQKLGLDIIDFKVFHQVENIPGIKTDRCIDQLINADHSLQMIAGRDMLIVAAGY